MADIDPNAQILVGAGNVARCDKTNDEATAAILDTIPGTVFMAGDGVNASGTEAPNYTNCYDPSWGRHKARTKPTVGSLDTWSPGAAAYYDYFGSLAGTRGQGYYSFDLGANWHMVVLNSTISMALGSPQELWLKADLSASTRPCIIGMFHHPRFSSAASAVDNTVKPMWDDLYARGASIILNAHSYTYERFAPQMPDGTLDTARGIREFVVGTGGISTSSFGTILPNSEVRNTGTYGVLRFALSDSTYSWTFIPVGGRGFTDSGSGACHGAINHSPTANPGGPYSSEGTVAFDGSGSTDPENNIPFTYAWSFGDGTTGTGVNPSHTYATTASYTVTLTVTDSKGATSTPATTTATIGNLPPAVNAGPDVTLLPGTPLAVAASFTDPGATDFPWQYSVDWGDGTPPTTGSNTTQGTINASHTYVAEGQYAVTVAVTDKDGATGSDQLVATISSTAVIAGASNIAACYNDNDEATAKLLDVIPGTVITLGDNAFPDGSPTDYANCYTPTWGRHKARTRPTPGNHDYQTPNAAGYFGYFGAAAGVNGKGWYSYDLGAWHLVVLNDQVAFDAGSEQDAWLQADLAASTKRCTIAMWHVPLWLSSNDSGYTTNPTRTIIWDRLYAAGVEIALNGQQHHYERFAPQTPAGVRDDASGVRQFNVGTGGESLALPTLTIAPNSEVRGAVYGVLKLTLGVNTYSWQFVPIAGQTFTDSGSGTCHDPANVPNQAPTATPGGPYTSAGPVTFDGTGSSDPDGNLPLTYAWSFGDGSSGTGATPSHTYTANGTYTVTLTVTDTRGGVSAPATTTATIANQPPVVNAGADASGQVAWAFPVSATFTDANGAGDAPWSYTIAWGDGGQSTGSTSAPGGPITGSHLYGAEGTYTVHVSVTDKNGASGSDDLIATIGSPVFVGTGDIGDCDRTSDDQTGNLLDGIKGTVFVAGDNAYPDGSATDYANCFDPSWGRHKWRIKPVPGNHDYSTANAAGYFGYFGAVAGDPTKSYYSFDLGSWHIVMLNSNVSMAAGSPQEQWLKADLAANPRQCTLGVWHHPRWSTVVGRGTDATIKPLWDDLYAAGADLIVNGHDHAYQRWAPATPAGVPDATFGIRSISVGTGGGEGLYQFDTVQALLEVRQNTTFGVLKLTLRPTGYDWQFVPVAGGTWTDQGSGNCHPAPGSANQAPTANPGGPYSGENTIAFNGSASFDPDGNLPLTYAWDFGDGSTGTGVTPTHTYGADGQYTVTLTVTDSKGAASTPVTTTASVANVAPVVNAGPDGTAVPGTPFSLTASFTDPGPDAPWTYTIAWGDGGITNGSVNATGPIPATHTYAADGQYTVHVTVTDKDGGTGSDDAIVTAQSLVTLVGAGNIARCDKPNDEATAAILDTVPGTVFTAGDGVFASGTVPPDYVNCYGPSWGRHKARTRPAVGSLDTWSPGSAAYYTYFGAAAGDPAKGYYSYDAGAWHIVVLNSTISTAVGSAQELWLKADLAASTKQCTAAIFHHPLFSSAGNSTTAVKPLWDDLYAAGAELIINAHAEVYERFAPQTSSGARNDAAGIREFIVGTGGDGTNTFGTTVGNSEVRSTGTYGVLRLTLSPTGYSWKFIPVAGKTFTDSGIGTCH